MADAQHWPADPGHLTYPQLIRHLQSCTPCAVSLHETIKSGRPGQRVARKERARGGPGVVDAVLGRALSDGDGQAAVVLYEMARASFRQAGESVREVDWEIEPAPFMDLRSNVCKLSGRLVNGVQKLQGLPAATPLAGTAADAADQCLDLADRFAPEWGWVGYCRAFSLSFKGKPAEALRLVRPLCDHTGDPKLQRWALRNAADAAADCGDWDMVRWCSERLSFFGDTRSTASFFALRAAVYAGTAREVTTAARRLSNSLGLGQASGEWMKHLDYRIATYRTVRPDSELALGDLVETLHGRGLL